MNNKFEQLVSDSIEGVKKHGYKFKTGITLTNTQTYGKECCALGGAYINDISNTEEVDKKAELCNDKFTTVVSYCSKKYNASDSEIIWFSLGFDKLGEPSKYDSEEIKLAYQAGLDMNKKVFV